MTQQLAQLQPSALPGAAGDPARALALAAELSSYLSLLQARHPGIVARLVSDTPDEVLERELEAMRAAGDIEPGLDAPMRAMRRAKQAAHLIIAAADLSGVWDLDRVVGALTALADAAVTTALRVAVREASAQGRLGDGAGSDSLPGLFILAMGKMGAGELNYSSDIDLIVLFDPDVLPVPAERAQEAMTRLVRDLVRLLDERTADGYVFRTDLRLRPDPASTAPAVSTHFAQQYYESVGQNWERMAHIKARVCAGDFAAGQAYLDELSPYVWRRHLDYWAIADIHSIKRQIHAHHGHPALDVAAFDVKLGRGGVREIEFFAQVQQLILGGRLPQVRTPATKTAVAMLTEAGMVKPDICEDLSLAYDFLRAIEHRIQMVNDEQTHELPVAREQRAVIGTLAGYAELADFERDIGAVRRRVHGVYSDLFATEERLSGSAGNLVFTGVDDDPGTVATLSQMGFADPSKVIRNFQAWHRGGALATRSARGRQLLTSLGPKLLEAMAQAGEPSAAFDRFSDFFTGLTGGVQTMSLMLAEPGLTQDIIETMAFAPRLAADLARRPVLLDAMLDPRFRAPASQDPAGAREARLREDLTRAGTFEAQLNAARRFHREEAFRIGYQLLRSMIGATEAGAAYADLADACVGALADAVEADVRARYGGSPGRWVVCGLGKFGGRELTVSSDLDLMLVYESDNENSAQLATRFVQRLVSALTAPTEEGLLYEVDMQLRPSGRAGPVAVRFPAFEAYYRGDAWTWEFMALTRLRPVAGDADLADRIMASARGALIGKSGDPGITADVVDMRRRMTRERPAKSRWDVKLTPGGLVDIEFVIQHEMLLAAGAHPEVIAANSLAAIGALEAAKSLAAADAATLREALGFQLALQQALRIAVGDAFDPETASNGLKAWLARHMGVADFGALEIELSRLQSRVERLCARKLEPETPSAATERP